MIDPNQSIRHTFAVKFPSVRARLRKNDIVIIPAPARSQNFKISISKEIGSETTPRYSPPHQMGPKQSKKLETC